VQRRLKAIIGTRVKFPTKFGLNTIAFDGKFSREIERAKDMIFMQRPIRFMLTAFGTLCVILGVVGMFLPLLPTTPFLLLAALCYSRGSPRFYHWLLNNRWCGEYIRNYREGRGITLRQKIFSIAMVWLAIGYSVFFMQALWLRLLLCAIAAGVTVHLLSMKTLRQL
jgi:uncharacterized protein